VRVSALPKLQPLETAAGILITNGQSARPYQRTQMRAGFGFAETSAVTNGCIYMVYGCVCPEPYMHIFCINRQNINSILQKKFAQILPCKLFYSQIAQKTLCKLVKKVNRYCMRNVL
jgi:hypothetical protein